ncbi:MAG: hypothetical protein ABW024_05320 [Microbacterium sp.]
MKRTLTWIAVAGSVVAAALIVRTALGRYEAVAAAARAVWDDPEVKKIRRRAVKSVDRAQKKARKALKNR